MAMMSLAPGFRFYPTDVELVMYYLKRKIMRKKLIEAIAEVNIYNFSPWDLPDMSFLKSKDLKWYFFCPREMKYTSGGRMKRATENGYWKTTGKDRPIRCNENDVGNARTLVFHLGRAPKGDRTDWVIHEYRILDNQLAGIQNDYVLCKIFKKPGPGPMNGTQYGAPFNEDEWSDDDIVNFQSHAIPLASDAPSSSTLVQPERQTLPLPTVRESGLSLTEEGPSTSAHHPTSEVVVDEADDEMPGLLAHFTVDETLFSNENRTNQGDVNSKGKNKSLPSYDIYDELESLDFWPMNQDGDFLSGWENGGYFGENMIWPDDQAYIELNDFSIPVNSSTGAIRSGQASVSNVFGSYDHDNIASFAANQIASSSNQYPASHGEAFGDDTHMGMQHMADNEFQQGSNAAFDLGTTKRQLAHGVKFNMERGRSADN